MAAAADHVGIVARVISAAIGAVVIGIIRRRRIVDAGASLDRAFVAPLVTATVGRLIGAVPAPGPAPLGIIGAAVHRVGRRRGRIGAAAIVAIARHPVGRGGVAAGIGGGRCDIV